MSNLPEYDDRLEEFRDMLGAMARARRHADHDGAGYRVVRLLPDNPLMRPRYAALAGVGPVGSHRLELVCEVKPNRGKPR